MSFQESLLLKKIIRNNAMTVNITDIFQGMSKNIIHGRMKKK